MNDLRDLVERVEKELREVRRLHGHILAGALTTAKIRIKVTEADDVLDHVEAILDRARFDGVLPRA